MGIRIENNVWITSNGNKDLMKKIPITVEEIESLMKQSSFTREESTNETGNNTPLGVPSETMN
jgi:hypothetical protein